MQLNISKQILIHKMFGSRVVNTAGGIPMNAGSVYNSGGAIEWWKR